MQKKNIKQKEEKNMLKLNEKNKQKKHKICHKNLSNKMNLVKK